MRTTIRLTIIDWIAVAIVVVGASNWAAIGLAHFLTDAANWNLVNVAFDGVPTLEFGIYLLVGLAGVWTVYLGARLAGLGRDRPVTELEPEPRA